MAHYIKQIGRNARRRPLTFADFDHRPANDEPAQNLGWRFYVGLVFCMLAITAALALPILFSQILT